MNSDTLRLHLNRGTGTSHSPPGHCGQSDLGIGWNRPCAQWDNLRLWEDDARVEVGCIETGHKLTVSWIYELECFEMTYKMLILTRVQFLKHIGRY